MDIIAKLAEEFSVSPKRIENTIDLIDQGNTIPFIARYRKEMTGAIDDQVLREFVDRFEYLKNLEKRKDEVRKSITEQGKLTPELEAAVQAAATLTELEDLYRPYRPKRKTRASVARAKGLQGLADAQNNTSYSQVNFHHNTDGGHGRVPERGGFHVQQRHGQRSKTLAQRGGAAQAD